MRAILAGRLGRRHRQARPWSERATGRMRSKNSSARWFVRRWWRVSPFGDSKIVLAKGGGFMAAVLPHGMRAIALDITPDNDAGGFILPNDHVDVILTRRDKWAEKIAGVEKYTSETILRNVRVLAVDQSIEDK